MQIPLNSTAIPTTLDFKFGKFGNQELQCLMLGSLFQASYDTATFGSRFPEV